MHKTLTLIAALAAWPAVAQQAADAVQPEATTTGGFAAMSPQGAAALQAQDDGVPVGKSTWADLLQPAIALAEGGFEVSPRLATLVAGDAERLARFDSTASYFLPQGQPLQAGTRLTNVAYADTLRTLAGDPAAFYTGAIAQDIVDTVNAAVPAGGFLSIWISPCMRRANAPPFVHRFRATRSVAWARHPRAR